MARRSRVELNRAALTEVGLAVGDGLLALADAMLANAHPHDAPPHGTGLVDKGGTGVWVDGKKVGGKAAKPRDLRFPKGSLGATAIVGFGFPARFEELGTVDTPAHPFLTPAVMQEVPHAEVHISPAVRRRLEATRVRQL